MSAARSIMLLSGVGLAFAAILAGLARSVGSQWATRLSNELFWTFLFAALVLAVILLIFRPPSRKSERRVNLAPPVTQNKLVRPQQAGPSRQAALPVTRTVRDPKRSTGQQDRSQQQQPSSHESPQKRAAEQQSVPDTASRSPGPVGLTMDKSAARQEVIEEQHPPRPFAMDRSGGGQTRNGGTNVAADRSTPASAPTTAQPPPSLRAPDQAHSSGSCQMQHESQVDAPPSLRHNADAGQLQTPYAGDMPPYDAEARRRSLRRREELETRLENLDQRANAAKVSLGLGRISHVGYRQYVKEVDRERTLIEGELMALRDQD